MNILRKEITGCMSTPVKQTSSGAVAKFSFQKDFTGFKGHFPDAPILPGVCKIQSLIVLAEVLNKGTFELKEIKESKFFAPVFADQEVLFEYSEIIDDKNDVTIKANVSCQERKIAKIELSGYFVFEKEKRV